MSALRTAPFVILVMAGTLLLAFGGVGRQPRVDAASAASMLRSATALDTTTLIEGDADCSGTIDPADVITMLRQQVGVGQAPCPTAADVNCDGHLTIIDPLLLLESQASLSGAATAGCPGIGQPTATTTSPTTFNLLDDAVANGSLNQATALEYKVFANFNDPRLPAAYKGADDPARGVEIMNDLVADYNSLPQAEKDALVSYLLPPSAEGSWVQQEAAQTADVHSEASCPPQCPDLNWQTISAAAGHIKVWWLGGHPEDEAKAQVVAEAFTDSIWDGLTGYMKRQPLSDATEQNNGGDGALDVYLVDVSDNLRGEDVPYHRAAEPSPCVPSPSWILLDRGLTTDDLTITAGHEFFHAIQDAYNEIDDCNSINWLMEATATWSQDFLNPNDNREHERTHIFDYPEYSLFDRLDTRRYSVYTFFLYLTRGFDPDLVRKIWEASEHAPVLKAVDETIPGGFLARWPEFSLDLWNQSPFDQLAQWDGITNHARSRALFSSHVYGSIDVKLDKQGEFRFFPGDSAAERLSAQYYHFNFPDDGAVSITISNPYSHPSPKSKVQALVKVAGQDWKLVDISQVGSVSFCRTNEDQNLQDLAIIVSNAEWDQTASFVDQFDKSPLIANNSCGWRGEAHRTTDVPVPGHPGEQGVTVQVDATDLVFAPSDQQGNFETVSGKVTTTFSGTDPRTGCILSGSDTIAVSKGDGKLQISSQDSAGIHYQLSGLTDYLVTYAYDCPGTPTGHSSTRSLDWVSATNQVSVDPTKLEGTFEVNDPGDSDHWGGLTDFQWLLMNGKPN